jgi:serine/threonine protein phosphatase PrpC
MPQPDYAIHLRASARTDRGRARQNNEDSVHLNQHQMLLLAVVADGMGGAVAGEEASRIAVETIDQQLVLEADYQNLLHLTREALLDYLVEGVRLANSNILQHARKNPELRGMGTTLTLALAQGHDVVIAHVGDSRAYLVDKHDESIIQLTQDHSFVQALVLAGHITLEEAEFHPMKHVLYRALGQSEDLEVDLLSGVYLNVGDRLVLCSDGLTLHVKPDEIREAALASDDPQMITARLVDLANSRGGKDNITILAIVALAGDIAQNLSEDDQRTSFSQEDDDPTIPLNLHYYSSRPSSDRMSNPSPKPSNPFDFR